MAMMPSSVGGNQSGNPYEHYDNPVEGDDLIDPDDGKLIQCESTYCKY